MRVKIKKQIAAVFLKVSLLLIFFSLFPIFTFAHRNPDDCTGSGLQISFYSNISQAHIGDVISYSASIFNGIGSGPIVCDASEIQASIVTPDDQIHPISLSRTALSNGESDLYKDVVTYIVRAQDVKADGTLIATASDTGVIHQNITNSQGGGNQGLNIKILSITPPALPPRGGGGSSFTAPLPVINIVKMPSSSFLSEGPGPVVYTYTVTNKGHIAMNSVWVKDDKCVPVTFVSGDSDKDSMLDLDEVWTYDCAKVISQTETNIATAHGWSGGWDAYATAKSTVVVSSLTPTPLADIVLAFSPSFPNAGFSPQNYLIDDSFVEVFTSRPFFRRVIDYFRYISNGKYF